MKIPPTCHIEHHVAVSGGGPGEVASVDTPILLPGLADDHDRQGTVARPEDSVPGVVNKHSLASGDGHSSR